MIENVRFWAPFAARFTSAGVVAAVETEFDARGRAAPIRLCMLKGRKLASHVAMAQATILDMPDADPL